MLKLKRKIVLTAGGIGLAALAVGFAIWTQTAASRMVDEYNRGNSPVITDRGGAVIAMLPNNRGQYSEYIASIPPRFQQLLLQTEDRFFFTHPGFNPVSLVIAALNRVGFGNRQASSTIDQQLVKILLGQETARTFGNKAREAFYTLALNFSKSKADILAMYFNSVYFGRQAQGVAEASKLYFGAAPDLLTDGQIIQLLATIRAPNDLNPAEPGNAAASAALARRLGLKIDNLAFTPAPAAAKQAALYSRASSDNFELGPFLKPAAGPCRTTIDKGATDKIRDIVERTMLQLQAKNVRNAAVVALKLPENQILALVGSPDPESFAPGYRINMLTQPRPIGSTIKPFIYAKVFQKGLRPYTLVDDREYKYITALGFPLYPKNYDYRYRGVVSLHYALSNSLNVPAVKALEYAGVDNFYNFFRRDLKFQPLQSAQSYQLGIALGGFEMSLWDLARYYTLFPNNGTLVSPRLALNGACATAGLPTDAARSIIDARYAALVNKILNDRKTGIEQFGLVSDLNLPYSNYALKTGTSRDFRDSWVMGFTPDFLVGAWMGNADASAMDEISGQLGAGRIWAQVMQLMYASPYNKNTPFKFDNLAAYPLPDGGIDYGLPGDAVAKITNALLAQDFELILTPHDGDMFKLSDTTGVTLRAREPVDWAIDGKLIGRGVSAVFTPQRPGQYALTAQADSRQPVKILFQIVP